MQRQVVDSTDDFASVPSTADADTAGTSGVSDTSYKGRFVAERQKYLVSHDDHCGPMSAFGPGKTERCTRVDLGCGLYFTKQTGTTHNKGEPGKEWHQWQCLVHTIVTGCADCPFCKDDLWNWLRSNPNISCEKCVRLGRLCKKEGCNTLEWFFCQCKYVFATIDSILNK